MDSGVRRMIHSDWYHGYVTGVMMLAGAELLVVSIAIVAIKLT